MFYFSGQRKSSESWNQMVQSSTARTTLNLRKRFGKTMKKRNKKMYEAMKANGAF